MVQSFQFSQVLRRGLGICIYNGSCSALQNGHCVQRSCNGGLLVIDLRIYGGEILIPFSHKLWVFRVHYWGPEQVCGHLCVR